MIATCSPMIEKFFDTMVVASSDKKWLWQPIQYKCWKLFWATLNCNFFDSCFTFFDLPVRSLTDRLSSSAVKSVEILLKIFCFWVFSDTRCNIHHYTTHSRWSGDVIARDWRENFIAVSYKAAAHSRIKVTARLNVNALQNYFGLAYTTIGTRNCAVNMRSVDLDSWEVFQFDGESVLHLDGSDLSTWMAQHAALATPYCNHLVFLL